MNRKDIEKLVNVNGTVRQSIIAMEECSELQQAISKCIREGTSVPVEPKDFIPTKTRENLIEEIADVMLMLEQLQVMYHVTDEEIYSWKQKKEEDLLQRLKESH